jgi:hypothetical protein
LVTERWSAARWGASGRARTVRAGHKRGQRRTVRAGHDAAGWTVRRSTAWPGKVSATDDEREEEREIEWTRGGKELWQGPAFIGERDGKSCEEEKTAAINRY